MESIVFTDKTVKPTDDLIYAATAQNSKYWISFFDGIRKAYPDAEEIWNYYNDGKSWLLKTVRKKKTLFWTAVFPGSFNITFYFGDKAAESIENSTIADNLKEQYRNGKRYGKIRSISIRISSEDDVANAIQVAELKNRLK